MEQGIILFGHGSRDPLWRKPIEAVAVRIAETSAVTVACAYLEHSTPDLHAATEQLLKSGVQAISILPMFLGVGKHAREDLPAMVAALRMQYPTVEITLKSSIGEDARLVQLLAEIALDGINP